MGPMSSFRHLQCERCILGRGTSSPPLTINGCALLTQSRKPSAMAKVLIGCETSGVVREAFLALGHDTWSCDLLPSDTPSNRHIQGDILESCRATGI